MATTAVILAAGRGVRAGTETPKQLIKVAGKALVAHAVAAFVDHPDVSQVIVVYNPDHQGEFIAALSDFDGRNVLCVPGGVSRNDSTRSALLYVKTDLVLIHDAVRPLVNRQTIDRVLAALHGGAVAVDTVSPSTDTLVTHSNGWVDEFPDRDHIQRGQTPQGFRTAALRDAALNIIEEFSDDCQLVHAAGFGVAVVEGDPTNIKVTHPGDFAIADRLFQTRRTTPTGEPYSGCTVVVGGSTGIGAALAELTAATIVGRSTGFDVTNPDPAVFEGADAVVITAGVLHAGNLLEQPDAEIGDMLAINLGGTIRTARAAAKHLAVSSGHLVLCASSSYTRGRAGLAVYSATKAAVVALTQALADEWPEVRVNCICPERTDTPMRRAAFGNEDPKSLMTAEQAATQILAMLGTPLTGQVFDISRSAA